MIPRFFQGTTVTGQVFASSAQTWAELVEKLNICPTLPITRKAFQALPPAKRNEAKQVPFFVPAVFDTSPSPRTTDHALHCNLVILDIDPEKENIDGKWVETGRCPAAPFAKSPQLLYEALTPYNFVAHLTASSTPEKPRLRVIVEAHEVPLAEYPRAVAYVASLLGLPSITRESKVPCQPMFLPTLFKEDTEEHHPMLASILEGKTLFVSDFAHHQNGAQPQGFNEKNGSSSHHLSSDGLEFLRAPLPEISLALAREALFHISPDCSYHEWLEIAASLKHQFAHTEEEEAYELFDEWSATSESKYNSPDETRAKWDSLRPTPVGREPRTIRSLLKLAAQSGWDDERLKDKSSAQIVEWMDQAQTATKLLEQGIRKILAAPQLSTVQEGMLLEQLKTKAKERFAHKVSITDLKRDLATLREKAKAKQPKEQKIIPAWAHGLCFVHTPKEFYRPSNGEKYKPDAFDLTYGRKLLPTAQSLIASGIPVTDANLSRPHTRPTDYVLNCLQVPCFSDYAYSPSQPNEMLFVHEKRKYVNTYAPTYPESDPANAQQAGTLFLRHLENLIAESDYRRTLIDFMAYLVQFPGQKIRWAVVIQGAEGAGKTYLAEVMKAVLGKRHVKMVDGTLITSGWSEWTFGYQLAVIEEVRVQGTNRFDIMNRLKPWITNDDIPINEKFRSSRDAINITNYMLFSNHHDCLAITDNDRRYFILKSRLQTKQQVLALGPSYFPTLFDFLQQHPGAMRAWLLDWKISSDFSPHAQAPRTKYVQEMISDSTNEVTATVRRLISEGDHPLIQFDILSAKTLREILTLEEGQKVTDQYLAKVLREEGYHQIGRHLIGSERHYLWVRPAVDTKKAPEEAAERVKLDRKNLCMELIYS